jgi:putative ABC transport system permease protein
MLTRQWLAGVLRRRTVRIVGLAACVALAVALVASLGAFITASDARMTTQAIAGVPVDWQVELASGSEATSALETIRSTVGVGSAFPAGYGDVVSFVATTGATVQTTGAGRALGLPAGYASAFPGELRYLSGAHDGVLLAQQTAANLHVGVGDFVTMNLPGGTSAALRIDGVVDLPAADSLFQIVGAPAGAGATAPPDNVVVLPLDRWNTLFRPLAANHPASVRDQVHLRLAHDLPPAPADAYTAVVARAHNLEARFAGAARVGDNLAAMLDAARADSVYSGLLFLFLGLPGVVLAWLLALVAGASGRDRRRREQALLRTRGASPRLIGGLALAEAVLVGVLGSAIGLGAAVVASRLAFGAGSVSPTSPATLAWAAVAALVGVALGFFAVALPALRDARLLTVRASQAQVGARRLPLWERLYLDVILLAGSGLIFWQSMRDAYQVVLVPEGVPTISINYLTLLAPMMFWIGFALLVWRLSALALSRAPRVLVALLRPLAGNLSGVVRASMSRQRALLARGLVLVALALSFAVSVAIFNTTYMDQAVVDAQLTNGADVSLTSGTSVLAAGLGPKVGAMPGVQVVEPMQHRLAYVGNDLQDLFGIDPATIGSVTPMSDAFFQGGTAAETLGRLAATPDGLLVSDETVKDFQLQLGDILRLRLQGTDHAYHEVAFRYVGIAREFPTAPHDSFLVANAAYVASATGVPGAETLLVKTGGASPVTVASRIRSMLGPVSGVTVRDLTSELKITLSALTAIDLSGLTRLELAFAVLMGAAASGLMLLLGFAERRRMFAIAHALGASLRQLSSFVWSEALFTAIGGALFGALGGWLEALIIVKILTGVFDPPPEGLSVPWAYLGLVMAVVAASVVAAVALAVRAGRRPALEVIRDL